MSGGAQKRNLTAGKMVSYAWNKLGVWLVFIILFIPSRVCQRKISASPRT